MPSPDTMRLLDASIIVDPASFSLLPLCLSAPSLPTGAAEATSATPQKTQMCRRSTRALPQLSPQRRERLRWIRLRRRRRQCCRETVRFVFRWLCWLWFTAGCRRESALSTHHSGLVGRVSGGAEQKLSAREKLVFFFPLTSLSLFPLDLSTSSSNKTLLGYSDFVSHFRMASSYIANHRSKTMVVLLPGEVRGKREKDRGSCAREREKHLLLLMKF